MSVRFICKECHNAYRIAQLRKNLCPQCFHSAAAIAVQSHPLPTIEVTPMLTQHDQNRAIELSDAAGRAITSGLHGLAEKLTAEAEKLLAPIIAVHSTTFEEWCAPRKYNLERYKGDYVSKMTQELHDLWVTAGGVPVK